MMSKIYVFLIAAFAVNSFCWYPVDLDKKAWIGKEYDRPEELSPALGYCAGGLIDSSYAYEVLRVRGNSKDSSQRLFVLNKINKTSQKKEIIYIIASPVSQISGASRAEFLTTDECHPKFLQTEALAVLIRRGRKGIKVLRAWIADAEKMKIIEIPASSVHCVEGEH